MPYVKVGDRKKTEQETQSNQPETQKQTSTTEPVETPKIRVKRDWTKKDKLTPPAEYFTKYPGMHPVWVRRTSEDMEEKEGEGYEYPTLTKDERKSKGPLAQGSSETSFITRGDLVLMHIPEEDYNDRLNAEMEPIRSRQRYIREAAERSAKLRGITQDAEETLKDE